MENNNVQTVENVQVEETVVANGNDIVTEYEANAPVKSYSQIIKDMLAAGGKRINNLQVKNVNYTDKDNYTMISFTVNRPIPGFVSNDNGNTYEKGFTTTIFTSTYAIAGALKEDADNAWLANALLENPKALNLILNGATIDIIQTNVPGHTEYVNPFASDKSNTTIFDHDTIINNIVKFKLGNTGKAMAQTLAVKLMGF